MDSRKTASDYDFLQNLKLRKEISYRFKLNTEAQINE